MPKFVLIYRGGNHPSSPEEGKANMARWFQWTKDAGAAMLEPNNPLMQWAAVTSEGTDPEAPAQFMGYSVVNYETRDEALALARACPFLDMGGTIDVAQIMDMPAG